LNDPIRRLVHPLYRALETRVHPLRYLFAEITQRCNLRCRHCGSDCSRDSRLDELGTEDWLRFFARLGRDFPPRSVAVVVTGGEPFCHPEFHRLADGLGAAGLPWGLVSNGWALTAANVDRLVQAGATSLTVSLDGLEASHDWLRGVPGAFARACAGIERAVAARLRFFDVVTCVSPRNLRELPEVSALLRRMGVPAWRLFAIFPKGRARGDRELLLEPAGLRELLAWIAAERRRLGEGGMQVAFSCEGYLPSGLDREVRDEPYFCRAGICIASVLADGAISACPNISRRLIQGNIRTDDFKTVWEERFAAFRDRSWMRRGPCAACGEWGRCQGNSLHLWDERTGEPGLCTFRAVTP
jgi:radical SAM protein with 4Fe4S-binding SPASM domain